LAKFLIIRLSSIGDIVLTTPVIRCLKKQVKDSEIHFLIKRKFLPVIAANPFIDKIHCLEDNLSSVIKNIKEEHYDYIIDLHNNIRSYIIKSRMGIKSFTVNKINFRKWLIVNFKINWLPDIHIVDRYIETIKFFGVQNDGKGLDYFISQEEEVDLNSLPVSFRNGYIAFVTGGKHATKQIPVEYVIALCRLLHFPIILLGASEDRPLGKMIVESVGENIFNACGNYTINQSAYLVKHAHLLITTDTGLMHIGAAFNKIILSVWGNTIPEFGMSPYMPHPSSRIYEVKQLYCRPCSKIGFKKCPRNHFRCMKDQDIERIAETANKLLEQSLSATL
jgi:ADP-heptose:LPS heptosyltransferase